MARYDLHVEAKEETSTHKASSLSSDRAGSNPPTLLFCLCRLACSQTWLVALVEYWLSTGIVGLCGWLCSFGLIYSESGSRVSLS